MHLYHQFISHLFIFATSLLLSSCYDDDAWSVTIYEPVCSKGYIRCNGNQEQVCNQLGQWEPPITCLDGSNCTVTNGIEGCNFRQDDQKIPMLSEPDLMIKNMAIQVIQDMSPQIIQDQAIPIIYPCDPNCPNINMIAIQPGFFQMGHSSQNTSPIHPVNINQGFWISKSEITLNQYRSCVYSNVCTLPKNRSADINCNWTDTISTRENEPINCVDWNQARTFANWMGGDLLSEAEWEYTARSQGFNQNYPWGDDAANCLRSIFQLSPLQICSPNTAEV